MSGAKVFVDTNILIYAYDRSAGEKHAKALAQLEDLWRSALGVISTQVLQEFFVNVTRKIPRPLPIATAKTIIEDLARWEVVSIEPPLILAAIDLHRDQHLSFWDAMIVAAARAAGARTLLSEDLNPGQEIEGVMISNPFSS